MACTDHLICQIHLVLEHQIVSLLKACKSAVHHFLCQRLIGSAVKQDAVLPLAIYLDQRILRPHFLQAANQIHIYAAGPQRIQQEFPVASNRSRLKHHGPSLTTIRSEERRG